jgi:hypothetical protein
MAHVRLQAKLMEHPLHGKGTQTPQERSSIVLKMLLVVTTKFNGNGRRS